MTRGSKWLIGLAAAGLTAFAGAASAFEDKKPAPPANEGAAALKTGTAVGEKIPEFKASLIKLDGEKSLASDLVSTKTARPTAYVFISQTCPFTHKYSKRLAALTKKYADKVDLLAVYPMRAETAESKAAFQKKNGYECAMINDADGTVAKALKISKTPEIVLCSKDGEILFRGSFDDNPESESGAKTQFFANAMDQHLRGEKVKMTTSQLFG